MSRHYLNTRFIYSMNIVEALVRQNDITTNLEWLYLVLNVFFHTPPFFNLNMVITWSKIYLGEHCHFFELIKQIFDMKEWIFILHRPLV